MPSSQRTDSQFAPFIAQMQAAGLPDLFIESFAHYYDQLVQGVTGLIPEAEIVPVERLPDATSFVEEYRVQGEAALAKTAVIKLNGGLGTSMGLEQAKSLLPVRDGLTFLDIIARQAQQTGVPLMLMDSFATQQDSLSALHAYPALHGGLPLSFLQHKEPKVAKETLQPVRWPADPQLTWCPPGHGDIYLALVTSGALTALLEAGYEYAFVSNADNLGAVVDPWLLGYFAANQYPLMMEVADRTEMDKKGGHLAQRADGQFVLRESAQCPPEDMPYFQDVTRHKYFNTNNLWLHLPALQTVLLERDYWLGLPMIRNEKTVDPRDATSPKVYQLETAMGSAIAIFAGAQAVRVPRTRFAPVKTTEDLLAVRSDAYVLTEAFHIEANPARGHGRFLINLDGRYYKLLPDLDRRFPYGPPSLVNCTSFTVEGEFCFGRGVVAQGDVRLVNETGQPVHIPDSALLTGEMRYP